VIRRLVWPAAVLVAMLIGTAVGLAVAVLVHGRLPDEDAVGPALLGTMVAVLLGLVAAPVVRDGLRAGIPALRRAPAEVSRRIGEAAAARLPADELLRRTAEALRSGLDSPRVEIWIVTEDGTLVRSMTLGVATDPPPFSAADLVAAARAGVAGEGWAKRWLPQLLPAVDPADARRAPMRIGAVTDAGELLGLVVVGRRPGAPRYDVSEDEALGAACRVLATTLRNRALTVALESSLVQLQRTNDELTASRTRVVTAADAERRRIERDLHDGAQQHLLGLAVTVGLVRQMVAEGDPADEVQDVLVQLGEDVRATVGELRSLAQGIYPALLMDGGVEPALRAAATRSAQPIALTAQQLRRYPAAIEAALYFCCIEALQNAAKHAPDASVRIELIETDGCVRATIADTGPGFDVSAAASGTGRTSMADRIGAHGGTVRWDSTPGAGTTVHVEVPVPAGAG
jgi:signal transduction histidine kinase